MIDEAPISVPGVVIFKQDTGAMVLVGPKGALPYAGQSWVPLPTGYTPDTFVWNATTRMMVEDLELVKKVAIQKIKDEAEQLKMKMMTPGGAKKEEYAANKAEVRDADQLGGALLTTIASLKLITGGLEARFPQAYANSLAFGDTVQDALNRFRGGIARSAPCPAIAAREAKVCADIRAATSKAAMNLVISKNKWPV